MEKKNKYPLLIGSDWLEKNLTAPNLRIFDCTVWLKPQPNRIYKIFSGKNIIISRILNIKSPNNIYSLNKSIASIEYVVKWESKNLYWLNIDLVPESHSWCKNLS